MVYTAGVKQKMDSILAVFSDDIRNQIPFDICYAEETGYVKVGPLEAGAPLRIDTPDKLVETLISGIADAVMDKKLPVPAPEDGDVPEEVKAEIYHQIMEPVKRITEDRAHYVHLAINYYQNRFEKRVDA